MPAYYVELEQETNLDQHDLKNILWLMNTLYYEHNTVIFIFIFILFLVGFDWSPNSEKDFYGERWSVPTLKRERDDNEE